MRVVEVDGTPAAVERLRAALADALDGGEAVLPVDPHAPDAAELRAAMRPDEPAEPDTALIVATSGSTGTPKGVLLSARALRASARATHARLGGPGHWLLATLARYIGGIQVLVRAHLAGTEPAVLDLARGFRPAAFEAAARELCARPGPHYTALVPTQLSRLLDAGGAGAELFDAIVLGGAPLPDDLRRRAVDAGVRVVSSYGMSETAGGCVYEGAPLDGVHLRPGEDGRVEIAGDVLTHGYRLAPELTASALVDGWFRTGDVGEFADDGTLRILGRVDDLINTGGVKVPAGRVEQVLTAHPAVGAACVVGLPDPEWGQRVAAAVVPADPARTPAPAPDVLRAHVRAELGAAAAPKVLLVVPELPLTGPGKVHRDAVRAQLTARASDAEQ